MPPILAAVAIAMVAGIVFLTIRLRAKSEVFNEPTWLREARERELKRRMPKWVSIVAMAGGLMFFAGIGMFLSALSSNPSHPDYATGHIYQLNNHGSYVYFTKSDYIRIFGTMLGGWSIGLVSGVVGYWIAKRRQPPVM
jgi:NhaP-type Na+/H+ or K+/H+ antiporter